MSGLPPSAELASVFDELSLWSSRFGALMLDELVIEGDRRILDVGCGCGFPLLELANMHGRTCRVLGVDLWQDALARAESKRRTQGLSHVMVAAADGARLPIADASIDLIVSNVGINNFDDPDAVLAECARVALPGARLAITTNPVGHMAELYAAYRATLNELGRHDLLPALQRQEDHRGTVDGLVERFTRAGFPVRRVVGRRFTMRYLDGGALMGHALTRYGFLEGWRSVVPEAQADATMAALRAKLDEIAEVRGELVMTVPMVYVEGMRVP